MFGRRKREIARLKTERERLYERIEDVEKDAAAHLAVAKRLAGKQGELDAEIERLAGLERQHPTAGLVPARQLELSERARRSLEEQIAMLTKANDSMSRELLDRAGTLTAAATTGREHAEVPA